MATEAKVVCPHDCPDTCVMTVTVEEGRATAIGGDPHHRFTQGFLCAKVNRYLERVYSPDRILHPLRRAGKKGEGRFQRITWDEALDRAAAGLRVARERNGGDGVGLFSCSKATNEMNFVAQKFMRQVLGSNNIDSCNRT